ncbi:MAG: ATP-binding cassette domain-containing protein, partial [Thermoleophilaceae bacterium]|nr:ATP-binding cassette domain-containing protein [Thermoleophilaceae bacterium]
MTAPLLEAKGIVKRFGTVEALRGADFTVLPGEVVALIGDNGAGKSTLVKTLSGIQPHD